MAKDELTRSALEEIAAMRKIVQILEPYTPAQREAFLRAVMILHDAGLIRGADGGGRRMT